MESLAGKKPEFEMPPKESFLFFFYSYIKVQRGERVDIRGKNQMMLSPAFGFYSHSGEIKVFFFFL